MSELEGRSTAALERLCGHFELGQRRQGVQIEALRRRIERLSAANEVLRRQFDRLDGQVRLPAQDYRTLAETLRGLWT